MLVTLLLIGLLGAVFLRGFKEAVGIAVGLVAVYLSLNAVVVTTGMARVLSHPSLLADWREALFVQHGSPVMMVAIALIVFPRLALGLSGFETGVAVMPLVAGGPEDTHRLLTGRIRNTRELLTTAALIMSVFLMTSSLVTTLLIPHEEFEEGGAASHPQHCLPGARVLRRWLRHYLWQHGQQDQQRSGLHQRSRARGPAAAARLARGVPRTSVLPGRQCRTAEPAGGRTGWP